MMVNTSCMYCPVGASSTARIPASRMSAGDTDLAGSVSITRAEWAPVVGKWWWRKTLGQHRYRAHPMKPRPAGTLALPGDMARLRVLVDEVTGSGDGARPV